jgi:threonine aldolase
MVWYEAGAPAAIAGVVTRTVPSHRGVMEPDELKRRIFKRSHHTPGTTLICLENTHNRAGGAVLPPQMMAAYRDAAQGIAIHLDGARVFNAAVALGTTVREITRHVDTVCCCLSKGLCAPVGSVLCGPADFIAEARYWRKRLGGGMRQAGLLAACGIVALRTMVDRLADDHARARRLAEDLAAMPGLAVDPASVQTNMVMVDTERDASEWVEALAERQVLAIAFGPRRLRLVLHRDVDDQRIDRAVEVFAEISKLWRRPRAVRSARP